jgi:hypothetical protein
VHRFTVDAWWESLPMVTRCLGFTLLLAFGLVAPALVADDKKPAGKDDKTKHVDADTLPPGPYTGTLVDVPDKSTNFTVRLDLSHLEPKNANGNQASQTAAREQARIAQLEAELARAKNPQEAQRKAQQIEAALGQLQQQMQKMTQDAKVVNDRKIVDCQAADDLKVRVMVLPARFDDEGNIKPYTDDEKKALKGKDTTLAGYEANLSDLKSGDLVRIRLVRKTPPKKDGDKDKPADNKDQDKDLGEKKSQVTVIVIMNDEKSEKDKNPPTKKP